MTPPKRIRKNTGEVLRTELEIAERNADQEDDKLAQAVMHSQTVAHQLAREVQHLQRSIVESQSQRGEVNAFSLLTSQLSMLTIPQLDLEGHHEREMAIRSDYIRARQWAINALLQELRRFDMDLDFIRAQLTTHRSDFVDVSARLDSTSKQVRTTDPMRGSIPVERSSALRDHSIDKRLQTPTMQSPPPADLGGDGSTDRVQPRIRVETRVTMTSESNFFVGFSQNLSEGGLFVATDRVVAMGTEVELVFTLPDGVEIRGTGLVRWSRAESGDLRSGVGVEFTRLGGAAEDAIENFVTERDPMFFPG
jgi:uncharacterized protein (TIGR02266 family)